MSHRYNTIDIIVGVGTCSIVFGALLVFSAANGTYHAATPQSIAIEQPIDIEFGMASLQPVLGQAIVDQALFERRVNQLIAQSASEWNQATLTHQEFQSLPGGPLGEVMRQAETVPADHMARFQYVMGRAIMNFTARGIRSGVLSADQYRSDYNTSMIRATESRGQRLDEEFASTWQTTLGQKILAAVESLPEGTTVASTEPASWPEIPMGYLSVAGFMLVIIFFVGLSLAARTREIKALAEMEHKAAKWVYRMVA